MCVWNQIIFDCWIDNEWMVLKKNGPDNFSYIIIGRKKLFPLNKYSGILLQKKKYFVIHFVLGVFFLVCLFISCWTATTTKTNQLLFGPKPDFQQQQNRKWWKNKWPSWWWWWCYRIHLCVCCRYSQDWCLLKFLFSFFFSSHR